MAHPTQLLVGVLFVFPRMACTPTLSMLGPDEYACFDLLRAVQCHRACGYRLLKGGRLTFDSQLLRSEE